MVPHFFIFLAKGMAIGFSTAVPIGPIGILCIQQSISKGRRYGVATGLGAATADMIFGSVAIFGVTMVSGFLSRNDTTIRIIGGIILMILGARMWFNAKKKTEAADVSAEGMAQSFLGTFLLTLTNPMTIIAYMTIFSITRISSGPGSITLSTTVVAGIFIGSAVWFLLLSNIAGFARKKMDGDKLTILNRVFSVLVALFGVFLIGQYAVA